MNKEAQEKIAERIKDYPNIPQFGGESKVLANLILIDLEELGYREGKPPLLSDENWEAINQKAGIDVMDIVINLDGRYTPVQQAELIVERCNLTAQAQRDSDIKWYEGQ